MKTRGARLQLVAFLLVNLPISILLTSPSDAVPVLYSGLMIGDTAPDAPGRFDSSLSAVTDRSFIAIVNSYEFQRWTLDFSTLPFDAVTGEVYVSGSGRLAMTGLSFDATDPNNIMVALEPFGIVFQIERGILGLSIPIIETRAVPEPLSLLLLGIGLVGLAAWARRYIGKSSRPSG